MQHNKRYYALILLFFSLTISGCSSEPEVIVSTDKIVPFTSQAPLAEWSDHRQQDACEEASALMAMLWTTSETEIDKQTARDTIIDIVSFQEQEYGDAKDTSAKDTLERIIYNYFNYDNARLKNIKSTQDLIDELNEGNIIIMPTNGKALKNPNFTNGGPEKHMLVLKEYDETTEKFITNDPGTRKGENYKYNKDIIFSALRNYPTTNTPISSLNEKEVIVVSR
jgi:hypothetical protein